MVLCATLIAEPGSMVSAPSAGNTAPPSSVMMVLSAISPLLTAEVPDMPSGTRAIASATILKAVRNGEPSGTPSAELTSTTLLAASAHQIARLDRLILAFPALRLLMAEVLVLLSFASLASR